MANKVSKQFEKLEQTTYAFYQFSYLAKVFHNASVMRIPSWQIGFIAQ